MLLNKHGEHFKDQAEALKAQAHTSQVQLEMDITSRCQQRYQSISTDLKSKALKGEITLADYNNVYWNLQVDQYQMYKSGAISAGIYRSWMGYRYKEWQKNDTLSSPRDPYRPAMLSYHDGFRDAVYIIPDKSFIAFYSDSVFSGKFKD